MSRRPMRGGCGRRTGDEEAETAARRTACTLPLDIGVVVASKWRSVASPQARQQAALVTSVGGWISTDGRGGEGHRSKAAVACNIVEGFLAASPSPSTTSVACPPSVPAALTWCAADLGKDP
jgi:hypothetical protein